MALTDTFIKTVKHDGSPAGKKHSDGGGLCLHVMAAGRYWRLNYRFLGKQKTLALRQVERDVVCEPGIRSSEPFDPGIGRMHSSLTRRPT